MSEIESCYTKAIEIRTFETFLLDLFSLGKINGTVHTCVGQEFTPVLLSRYFNDGDMVFSNHRGHGHYLALENSEESLLREIMGSSDGVSGGVGGSQHIQTSNFLSNGIQGGLAPVSVGWAYTQKIKNLDNISICYVGDGTLGEGQFYEALNLAAMHKTPTLFVLESNQYAQSTPTNTTFSGSIHDRLSGFGLEVIQANVWDLETLNDASKYAVERTRRSQPTILIVDCYRLNSHSKGDDNRDPGEIRYYSEIDLLNKFRTTNPEIYHQIEQAYCSKLELISSKPVKLEYNRKILSGSAEPAYGKNYFHKVVENSKNERMNARINKALDRLCSNGAIIIGEDICDTTPSTPVTYGGAFKVTKGLSSKYPNRVLNAPIGEAGIVGFSIGVALAGEIGVAEIMFGDFTTLIVDQMLQQASKIPSMYGSHIDLPLILRTPMGGRRGYGPTHSQNLERLFLYWPNLNVVALNVLSDPGSVLDTVSDHRMPYIIIEDKVLYTEISNAKIPEFYDIHKIVKNFSTYIIKPEKIASNTVIFCYGAMLQEVLHLIEKMLFEEKIVTIVAPELISQPIDLHYVNFDSISEVVIIEEGGSKGGWGSELELQLRRDTDMQNIIRVANDEIIACSKALELAQIPNRHSIMSIIQED